MAVNGSDGSCGSHSAISSFLADANKYCGRLLGKVLCQTPSVLVTNYTMYVERFHFNAWYYKGNPRLGEHRMATWQTRIH